MAFERIKQLLALLAKLRELFPKLSLEQIFAIVAAAGKLLPLPDLADEAGCRQWCRTLAGVLAQVAEITPWEGDDAAIAALTQVINDDGLWAMAWQLKGWLIGKDPALVSADPEVVLLAQQLGGRLNIDWAKLLEWAMKIIPMILPFFLEPKPSDEA